MAFDAIAGRTCEAELAAGATELREGPVVDGLLRGRHADRHAVCVAGVWRVGNSFRLLANTATLGLREQA